MTGTERALRPPRPDEPKRPAYQAFPYFDPNAYLNGQLAETPKMAHAADRPVEPPDVLQPPLPPAAQPAAAAGRHASLLWAGVNASPSSDLVRLSEQLHPADLPAAAINQTTLLSMDLDRAGAAPYIYDPTRPARTASPTTAGGMLARTVTPRPIRSCTIPAPLVAQHAADHAREFDPNTWRSILPGALTRMNLDRPLAPYPARAFSPLTASSSPWTSTPGSLPSPG